MNSKASLMKSERDEGLDSSIIVPHSSLRILLWDIDGTLIHSLRRGAFKDYTVPMLEEVFGTAGRLPK